ncbi:MAG: hypothetical protein NXH95_06010 [Pseudomonadaceae bacterium]|nr:hypothetical protein [Pseudomonadaceae bacterium]
MTRIPLYLFCCLAALISVSATQHAEAVECDSSNAPETLTDFSFLIGRHEVSLHAWTGEAWTPPRPTIAEWRGWYGLDDMAIYDEWKDPGAEPSNIGINVRFYDDQENLWKMMWISSSGRQVQDLRAEFVQGKLTMWQVYPPREGWKAEFDVIDSGSWSRTSFVQDDTGEWQPQFKLVARRTHCEDRRLQELVDETRI